MKKMTLHLTLPSANGWKPSLGMADIKDGIATTAMIEDRQLADWHAALKATLAEVETRLRIVAPKGGEL